MRTPPSPRLRAGFTIFELLITVVLFFGVLGAFALASQTGVDAYEESKIRSDLTQGANRVVERMCRELVGAGTSRFDPMPTGPFGSSSLTYEQSAGWDGGEVQWANEVCFEWRRDPGEVDNGADDDGDELVDEGTIVMILRPGEADEQMVVLAHDVAEHLEGEERNGDDDNDNGLIDEGGLSFVLDGEILTVRVTLVARTADDRTLFKTVESSVFVRN